MPAQGCDTGSFVCQRDVDPVLACNGNMVFISPFPCYYRKNIFCPIRINRYFYNSFGNLSGGLDPNKIHTLVAQHQVLKRLCFNIQKACTGAGYFQFQTGNIDHFGNNLEHIVLIHCSMADDFRDFAIGIDYGTVITDIIKPVDKVLCQNTKI